MKKILLCAHLLFLHAAFLPAQQIKRTEYIHPPITPQVNAKAGEKGSKLIYCQVLRVTDKNSDEKVMAVFSEVTVTASYQRAKMRNSYMLKRERVYLGTVFFTDVDVLEESNNIIDIRLFMKTLKERYTEIKIWSVLDGDTIL